MADEARTRAHAQHARLYEDGELVQRLKQVDALVARLREELDMAKAWRDALVEELARRDTAGRAHNEAACTGGTSTK